MSELTYQQVLHGTALRMNALSGQQVAQIAATYDTANLTAANFKSADWPINSFRDAIIMAVERYAQAIAETPDHAWRAFIGDQTDDLANHNPLPSLAITGKEIIGVYGDVWDSADATRLEPRPLDVVRRINQETWRTYPLYFFNRGPQRIEHTRPLVRMDCCVFSRNDQLMAWAANGTIPLPAVLELGLISAAIASMVRDSSLIDQAATYAKYADEQEMRIRAGQTTPPEKAP